MFLKFNVVRLYVKSELCTKLNSLITGSYYNSYHPLRERKKMGQLLNVIMLGTAFLFLFISFQTMSNIEKTMLTSTHEDDPSYMGDGYISLATVYATFSLSNWIAPSVVSLTGPRLTMVLGSLCYLFFTASFLVTVTWVLYGASIILGFGAALIWTGQGNYLILNSDKSTVNRNSGIFWALFQFSILLGNLFVFFSFQNKDHIDADTRRFVYITLSAVSVIGIVLLTFLRKPVQEEGAETTEITNVGPIEAFFTAVKLLFQIQMILLVITFLYSGVLSSFANGVYGSSIGFTSKIAKNPKPLVGLSGVFFGLGEVLGGGSFIVFGKRITRLGSTSVIAFGCVIHLVAFVLIFLNIPGSAISHSTTDVSILQPSPYIAMFCSFALGIGDSCFNTQVYSVICKLYPKESAAAFALFKFVQSLSSAMIFVYSNLIDLHVQLLFLGICLILGTLSFITVDQIFSKKERATSTEAIDSNN